MTEDKEFFFIKYQKNLQMIQQLQNENIVLVSKIKDYEPPVDTGEELIDTHEISKLLGVSEQKCRDLISQELIHGYGGGKAFRAKRGEVLAYREKFAIRRSTAYENAMAR